ncbi:MAG: flagellar biosynthesis protein FliH [Sphingomonas sp. 28-62-20]|uniref:FliH/SctL family protein n=1 Tax=Sphingomonas sp. 28-62-20 TaxID=1970433 RepID=UPI000BDD5CAC|nr:MAG: flagellar biosynthesis protein FliH [Sphingomonas sp. 28-62-20]
MSNFAAGFSARHDAAAQALHRAIDDEPQGFAPADLKARAVGRGRPKSFAPQESSPKSFSPADPANDPTQGWDPLNPQTEPTGFVDPIETARANGFAEGVAHGRDLERQTYERDVALLQALAHALKTSDRFDRDQLARQLRESVLVLLTKLVGEVGISADLLASRVAAAADMLADSAESATLRVHPDDSALLADKLPATITLVGDAAIDRGSFLLESASTIVEDGPELWLEQLAQAIDRVAVPSC